jgi:hypothetical protein
LCSGAGCARDDSFLSTGGLDKRRGRVTKFYKSTAWRCFLAARHGAPIDPDRRFLLADNLAKLALGYHPNFFCPSAKLQRCCPKRCPAFDFEVSF